MEQMLIYKNSPNNKISLILKYVIYKKNCICYIDIFLMII